MKVIATLSKLNEKRLIYMAKTIKNAVNAKVKRLYEIRSLLNELQKEEKAVKNAISEYMQENSLESFETSSCNVKFRHVKKLELDKKLGLSEDDLINVAIKKGWTDCIKLVLDKNSYNEHSKEINNGKSVFIENERLDLIFTFKKA